MAKQSISELKELLELEINERLEKFSALSKQAKEMVYDVKPRYLIDRIYLRMAKIALELQPIEELIRLCNPTYPKFFAALIEFHDKKLKGKQWKRKL